MIRQRPDRDRVVGNACALPSGNLAVDLAKRRSRRQIAGTGVPASAKPSAAPKSPQTTLHLGATGAVSPTSPELENAKMK
jgi:hypothetical protein